MSFAVIQTGGKQYKVSASEIIKVEKLDEQKSKTIEFKTVLCLSDDKITEVGNPNIQGAKVEAEILKNTKNKTIIVFKKRRRKNSRKKYGHRQQISVVRITKIFSKDGKLIAQAEPRKEKKIIKKTESEGSKDQKDTTKPTLETNETSKTTKAEKNKKKSLTVKKK